MNDATKKWASARLKWPASPRRSIWASRFSGASAADSATAFKGLSDAFADGALEKVPGQFNAISQAAPGSHDGHGRRPGRVEKKRFAGFAGAGLITADVMAVALPNALGELRKEAVQFETIGGSFTVLSNNVMEFTARQAESTGAVRLMTSGVLPSFCRTT